MITIPTFIVGNNVFQDVNAKGPSFFTFPVLIPSPNINYFSEYPSCVNVINPLQVNKNNQIYTFPSNIVQIGQLLKSESESQLQKQDDIIGKNIDNCESCPNLKNIEKCENNPTIQNDINDSISNNSCNNLSSGKKSKKNSRFHFTKEEDDKIKELVNQFGTKSWTVIAAFMNGRNPKQIRDRYSNYLMPGIFHGEWSKEEDDLLIKKFKEYGSKWSIIQNFFPNRSSNSIKNRWHYFLHKKYEKLIEAEKKEAIECQEIEINEDSEKKIRMPDNENIPFFDQNLDMEKILELDLNSNMNFEDWILFN
ncbi:hypothetical protein M9Y10_010227 [Tritrichomonas musculus]|uniref:Myb-like DNA-binding domain containing protein n=1 Tax=Tritrichomonas musculus TaxID=1915356 RepID=A0ABR2IQN9_9EUKA